MAMSNETWKCGELHQDGQNFDKTIFMLRNKLKGRRSNARFCVTGAEQRIFTCNKLSFASRIIRWAGHEASVGR